MIKRVKLETIYKMAKEDNEKIEECKTFKSLLYAV